MTVFNSIYFLNSKTKLSNNCSITYSEIIKQILSQKKNHWSKLHYPTLNSHWNPAVTPKPLTQGP